MIIKDRKLERFSLIASNKYNGFLFLYKYKLQKHSIIMDFEKCINLLDNK